MKATITRTGGFAGVTTSHEINVSEFDLRQLKESADGIQPGEPDAFTYELTANGETFTVRAEDAERLLGLRRRGA